MVYYTVMELMLYYSVLVYNSVMVYYAVMRGDDISYNEWGDDVLHCDGVMMYNTWFSVGM